jgi:glycosyltransferase involved in cell wall biosynthesis
MKVFFIKLGKAWAALKRDGLWRGGKRIAAALSVMLQRVPPADILIVSGGVGDSARYRAKHVAEELNLHGLSAAHTYQDNPILSRIVSRYKVVVFHRVLFTKSIEVILTHLKAAGVTVLFETDDLVYDPQYLHLMDYYTNMNSLEKKLYENGVGGEILSDPYVQYATTSTPFLQQKLTERGKQVFLVRNKMSQEDVRWAEEILAQKVQTKKAANKIVRIAYLSGTPSHNKDFATITEPLCRILAEFPQVSLVLAGPLDTNDALAAYRRQIIRVPFAPRKEYFATVASVDITVAPLEIGNAFCEAKSELKFFEAGLFSVPTVASRTGTFEGAITDGTDGFVACSDEEWYEKLKTLVTDTGLRQQMGEAARVTTLTRYTTQNGSSPEYYTFLQNSIKS